MPLFKNPLSSLTRPVSRSSKGCMWRHLDTNSGRLPEDAQKAKLHRSTAKLHHHV